MNAFAKYYRKDLKKLLKQIVPAGAKTGNVSKKLSGKYDYIILPNTLAYTEDVQQYLKTLKKHCHQDSRIVVVYFNLFWKPILELATKIKLRKKDLKEPNWLSINDISNLFSLEEYDAVKIGRRLLLPIELGFVSSLINNIIAQLPLINRLCITTYQIYRPEKPQKKYSVSVVIPARNEEGNIKGILKKLPKLGKHMEIIFVEGHSKDNTCDAIKTEITTNRKIKSFLYKQKGKGKANAVRLGFEKAKNDIFMILDADLTVNPKDLLKFYDALSRGYCEFANGSRLIYPMEKQAMRMLNFYGNKLFSFLFTYLLGQEINDTLCGTKALFRKDYERIKKNRKIFGDFDPFGDYDLLFGATKLNLKIKEIPIRYRERTYGETNINRFTHGWLLAKMTVFAARKIKFI